MEPSLGWSFPAIRGVQAGREFFVSMCPMGHIPKMFLFDEKILPAQLRAQRILNKGRIPQISSYLVKNPKDYVFSALTASIDAKHIEFTSLGQKGDGKNIGILYVPLGAKFIINDGQHRRAAIEMAMKQRPGLADESIAVVFFLDRGLARCQQMFADLNRYAIRPSTSIGVLYDHRDSKAVLARLVALQSEVFKDLVENERTTLSMRSSKLFTLSAIFHATEALIEGLEIGSDQEVERLALDFWEEVAEQFPAWEKVRKETLTAGAVREDYIHSYGITLQAIGKLGNYLLRKQPKTWKNTLKGLGKIDWSRKNSKLWEGRAIIGGRVSKTQSNVVLVTAAIKQALKVDLTPEEERIEAEYRKGQRR
jgi:DNA sulfur modification protein DndB